MQANWFTIQEDNDPKQEFIRGGKVLILAQFAPRLKTHRAAFYPLKKTQCGVSCCRLYSCFLYFIPLFFLSSLFPALLCSPFLFHCSSSLFQWLYANLANKKKMMKEEGRIFRIHRETCIQRLLLEKHKSVAKHNSQAIILLSWCWTGQM